MTSINWLERDRWSTPPRGSAGGYPSTVEAAAVITPLAAHFERHGSDLVLVVRIRATEAEHGAIISVPAPGAEVRLRVPPGSSSGRCFRIPRPHAPAPDGFGDLLVMVQFAA